MFVFSRRVGIAFLALAVAVAVSRVALGLHYPSDVLAGAAVGALSALVVVYAGRRWVELAASVASRVSDPVLERLRRAAGPRG